MISSSKADGCLTAWAKLQKLAESPFCDALLIDCAGDHFRVEIRISIRRIKPKITVNAMDLRLNQKSLRDELGKGWADNHLFVNLRERLTVETIWGLRSILHGGAVAK